VNVTAVLMHMGTRRSSGILWAQ